MNTTLPPARDLPAHAHARIRGRLEREVARRPRSPWLLPLAAGTAVAVLVVFVVFVAWPQPGRDNSRPAGPTAPTATTGPDVPGVSPEQRARIEKDCRDHGATTRKLVLYRLSDDAAGQAALLYHLDGASIDCQLSYPEKPRTSTIGDTAPLEWLPGPVSLDVSSALSGGDTEERPAEDAGRPGVESVSGRITSEVVRVTYTSTDGATQDAVLANGTFVARLLRPTTWQAPDTGPVGIVRAFDADGVQLGAVSERTRYTVCYRTPDGKVIPRGTPGKPESCRPAVRWR